MTADEAVDLATDHNDSMRYRLHFAIEDHQLPGESFTTATERYAQDVLYRDARTVRRWLSGESPIPRAVAKALLED